MGCFSVFLGPRGGINVSVIFIDPEKSGPEAEQLLLREVWRDDAETGFSSDYFISANALREMLKGGDSKDKRLDIIFDYLEESSINVIDMDDSEFASCLKHAAATARVSVVTIPTGSVGQGKSRSPGRSIRLPIAKT